MERREEKGSGSKREGRNGRMNGEGGGMWKRKGGQERSDRGQRALQIILDLYILEIELANTRSQISLIYFQSHS
jgi:hypothetical protein